MDFFDKAKDLAREAQAGINSAEDLLNQAGGFLPSDRKAQLDGLLGQANSALSGITGEQASSTNGQTDDSDATDDDSDSSDAEQ
jgi:hypothetical protein